MYRPCPTLGLASVITAALAGPTRAEPEPAPYPRAHVARPLLLPRDALEVAAELLVGSEPGQPTIFDGAISARRGWARFEFEAGTTWFIGQTPDEEFEPFRFRSLYATGRLALGADQALGVGLAVDNPTADQRTYRPSLTYRSRRRPSPTTAIETSAATWYSHRTFGMRSFDQIGLAGRLQVEGQLTPTVTAEGHGTLTHEHLWPDPGVAGDDRFAISLGGGLWLATARHLDLFVTLDLPDLDRPEATVLTVGVAARRR